MPNPLLRMTARSKTNTDRPVAIAPVPEEYEGHNNPYRGTEEHGVTPNTQPHDPDVYGVDPDNPNQGHLVKIEMSDKEPDPIPVRVVQEYKRELRRFGSDRISLDFTTVNNPAGRPIELLGRSDSRSSVKLINLDGTNTILVSNTREEINVRGYPLLPGKELSLTTEDPIFVAVVKNDFTFPNAVATLAYLAEYSIKEA